MEIGKAAKSTGCNDGRIRPVRGLRAVLGAAGASFLLLMVCFAASAAATGTTPVITEQPKSILVEAGQSATFKSTATATPSPTVQWESSFDGGSTWKEVSKATSTTLTIKAVANGESGLKYRAKFTSGSAKLTTTSEAATLTVAEKPVVTHNPSNATVAIGGTAEFEASATAFPVAETQWELSTDAGKTWSALPGEVLPYIFVTPPSGAYNGYEYRAKFTNVAGSVFSGVAILSVHALAKVTLQPEDTTVLAGENATFESAQTGGFPEPAVQWEVSSDNGSTWANVPGATKDLLTISPAAVADSGNEYRAAFTNDIGTARSEAASLFVAAQDYAAFGWGQNTHGQAGVGSSESSIPAPLPISGLHLVTAVSGGLRHSLALLANETVESWGFNSRGQLGNEGAVATKTPIAVENLKHVTAIAAGGSHSLALLSDGTVKAWGDNESGQLGNGKFTDSEVPVAVEGLTQVKAIAAGDEHSLALLANGTVMAWGSNELGELGVPGKSPHNTPVEVKGLTEVAAIAAGGQYNLALLKNGTVVAWGDDQHGQLGNQAVIEGAGEKQLEEGLHTYEIVNVEGLSGVSAISAGRSHALALLSTGTVESWGNDSEGELGNGITEPQADTPAPVSSLSGVSKISAGDEISVAVLSSGVIDAWGSNNSGSLGIGTTGAFSDVPVQVHSISGAAGVSAGGGQVLAFGASLPTVSALSPSSGPLGGGNSVTISGQNVGAATAVHFGTTAATGLVVNSSSSLTVTAPAGTGTVNVTVTTPSGTSPVVPADRYTYRPAPTVVKLSVKGGPASGGTVLTITGTELNGTTAIEFGAVSTSEFTVTSNSSITVTSPANVGGTLDVRIVGPDGVSAVTTKDHFKYVPSVEAITPAAGPKAGGTSVTITGSGFALGSSASLFKFGKVKVSSLECTSTSTCTAVVPAAKSLGAVVVTVTVAKAKGTTGAEDHYTYE